MPHSTSPQGIKGPSRILAELPSAPPGKSGWPWTVDSPRLPDQMPGGSPWPRVSVVTPSFNQGQFIEETIRSVLLQGYPNLEYIIVDGGSTDDSVGIIRKYETWLTHWVSEPDRGQSHAINKGFARATGEIVAWLNSDDVYVPGALDCASAALANQPEVGLVYGNALQIDADGQYIGICSNVRTFDRAWLISNGNLIAQPAAFFRAKAFRRIGGLDETLNNVMDYDLWIRMGDCFKVSHVPAILAKARIYPGTKTSSTGKRRFDEIERVARRHGAKRLPSGWASELADTHLRQALRCYSSLDMQGARREIVYVMNKVPRCRRQRWIVMTLAKSLLGGRVIGIARRIKVRLATPGPDGKSA